MEIRIKEVMFKASRGWNDHLYQVPDELMEKFVIELLRKFDVPEEVLNSLVTK